MGDNIDNLSFGIILKDEDFKKKMKEVEGMAKNFERSVASALAVTELLKGAQRGVSANTEKEAKETEKKAKKQKEVVTLTRQELEAKKAAGTATKADLLQLNAYLRSEKLLLDEEKKRVQLQKEQVRLKRQENLLNNGTSKDIQLTSNQLLQQNAIMKGLTSMAAQYFSVFGAVSIVRNLVRITGEFEAQHTALRAILQDTAAADNIYNQLQVLAVKSPYTFQNLVGYAKQLTAFSVPVNEVYETTKKLADVSAGLGVDLGRIILAYGQVRSAEFLRGQEVRQFTEASIPILKELADQIQEMEGHAISVGEVFDRISARQIPFAMVEEAFNRMASAGGKFYNMQEVLAETVKGKVSNLQDAWEIMLSRIGEENSGLIKGSVNGLTELLQNYEKWIGLLGAVIEGVGIYNGLLLLCNAITKVSNGIQVLKNGYQLVSNQQVKLSTVLLPTNIALEKLEIKTNEEQVAALMALNVARKAALGVIAAVAAATLALIQHLKRNSEESRKTTDTINAALSKLSVTMADFKIGADKVKDAFVKMKNAEGDATEETKAFNKSVDDLKKQFPKFIDDHIKMTDSVEELGKEWTKARLEMNQYYADEAANKLGTDLRRQRDDDTQKLENGVTKWIRANLSRKEWETSGKYLAPKLVSYVRGDIDENSVGSFVESFGQMMFGEKAYNRDLVGYYKDRIMGVLDAYKTSYKKVLDEYKKSLDEGEQAIKDSGLSTTRSIINEAISDKSLQISAEEDISKYAERLRDAYKSPEATEKIKKAIEGIFEQFSGTLGNLDDGETGWRKDVNNIIRDFKAKGKGNAGINELLPTADLGETIEQWRKDLDEVQKVLADTPQKYRDINDSAYRDLLAREKLLETISQFLYGNKTFAGTTKSAKSNAKDVVANLKQEFQDLKELKSAYDKFKSLGFEDKQINGILNNFFGVGIPEGGFDSAFELLATRMGKYSKNDAQDIRNYATGKDWKAFYDSEKARLDAEAKALEDYNKRIAGYIEDAKSIQQKIDDLEAKRKEDLSGATTDEQKKGINFHYDTEIDKLKESLIGLTSIQLTDFWQQLTGEKNGTYGNLTKLQRVAEKLRDVITDIDPNRNKDGKITGYTLTQEEHGDILKDIGVDAQSLQLSVAQVEALNKAIESLISKRADKNGIFAFFDAVSQKGGFKDFWKQIQEGSGPAMDILRGASKQMSELGGIFIDIGEATDSRFLTGLGDTLSFVGSFVDKIASGDLLGAVGEVVKGFTSWITASEKLKQAISDAADEAERLNAEARLSRGVDSIFGENVVAKIRNAIDLIKEYRALVDGDKRRANQNISWKSGFLGLGTSSKSLADAVKEMGYDLYDEYGNLNSVALQAILDKYEYLEKADREWISEAIKNSEIYADAMEQLDDVVGSFFGSIADNLVDTFIDNFLQMGGAVDNLGDAFTNLGDTILRSMLKSFIIDEILKKYENEVRGLTQKATDGEASADEVASELAAFADRVGKDIEASGDFIQQMIQAFYDRGLLNDGTANSSNSLPNGIKSITEDTANLLASYINAIRADVSYGKTQWERIAVAVEGQNTRYITLNDYIMQVQANTANIAVSNQRILDHIESVLTSEGGFTAIRTYS